ncbi:MAG TPA: hypothetical protein VHP33_00100, partial [Polyangiaceae bacterium]|nr:hypothetical protein [Polyangiaceae bacterium]
MLPYRALFGLGPLVCLSLANSAQAATSAGCGVQGKPTGAIKLQARDGRGTVREYEVLIPASYTPSTPLALTFVYHEAGGTSASAKAIGLQSAPGAAAASIFVFPQGVPYQSAGVGWNDSCTGYDMPFFDNMLATLEASYCIDQQRVFAGGFSWGCDHVTSLACCRGDRLRAIAAASCSDDFSEPARYQSYLNPTCAAPTPPAVRFTHALSDDNAYPSPLFATTSALFRSWNGCSTSSTATPPSPCRAFDGCRSPLIECAYPGLGHALSSGFSAETWSFFSSLPTTSTPTRVATIPAGTSGAHVALGFLLLSADWLGL